MALEQGETLSRLLKASLKPPMQKNATKASSSWPNVSKSKRSTGCAECGAAFDTRASRSAALQSFLYAASSIAAPSLNAAVM